MPIDNHTQKDQHTTIMPLQLVKTSAQRSFAQRIDRLEAYCELTGKHLDDCILEAMNDYMDTVVEAKLSQFEKLCGTAV